MYLENYISEDLDTLLAGPREAGQATPEDARRPPVEVRKQREER